MRQPVASVLALAAAALAEPGLPRAARSRLDQIVGQAEWLADILEQRLRAPQPALPSAANLAWIVSEAVAAERPTCSSEITVVWPADPVLSPLSRVDVRRMIANLLSNATRAAGPSGKVTVGIERHDGRALIVIEDSGPGFGEIEQGFGLGLQAVACNVVSCGGRLECCRSSLGGVQVSLWLPLVDQEDQAGAAGRGQDMILDGAPTALLARCR